MVKNLHANAGDLRDTGSIPGLETSPGGNFLENSMDRRAWKATAHMAAKSQT